MLGAGARPLALIRPFSWLLLRRCHGWRSSPTGTLPLPAGAPSWFAGVPSWFAGVPASLPPSSSERSSPGGTVNRRSPSPQRGARRGSCHCGAGRGAGRGGRAYASHGSQKVVRALLLPLFVPEHVGASAGGHGEGDARARGAGWLSGCEGLFPNSGGPLDGSDQGLILPSYGNISRLILSTILPRSRRSPSIVRLIVRLALRASRANQRTAHDATAAAVVYGCPASFPAFFCIHSMAS